MSYQNSDPPTYTLDCPADKGVGEILFPTDPLPETNRKREAGKPFVYGSQLAVYGSGLWEWIAGKPGDYGSTLL